MTLAAILGNKGRDVVTSTAATSLREITRILAEKGIGAVLITDAEQKLLGIVSERDIVRAVARHGGDVLDDKAEHHMTSRVVTATRQTGVAEAMTFMTDGRFRHVPVMEGDRVDGLVSIGDLVKYRLSEIETENKALHKYITAA